MAADESPEKRPAATKAYSSSMREAGPYFGLGIEITIAMGFFVLLGYLADRWLGTSPWLLLVGVCLSAVATGALLWRVVQESNRKSAAERAARKQSGEAGGA